MFANAQALYDFTMWDASVNPKETLADIHHFNTGIFKVLDFVIYRLMKLLVLVVDFLTTFIYAIVHQALFLGGKEHPFSFKYIMGTWINNLKLTCPKTGHVVHFDL